ncbi:MAG: SDR family NAD(P)-dependent oxidoreductase [Halioglobus sp.]
MRVLLTGGTGLVGSHACRMLQGRGHALRLLVRDPARAQSVFSRFDAEPPEFVRGDITEPVSIAAALEGCEALVHCAAATPMQSGSVEQLFQVNVDGVKHVVGQALDSGISRIVCISSITAIFNADASKVNADAPPTPSRMPYGQSKVQAELYLRGQQDAGKPIAIIYPGGILGPDDPGFSDSCKAIKHRIDNGFRLFGAGGMQ